MNLLAINNISKYYGVRTLFEDISFNVTDEDKIGIIGVNGTGKSSLLRIIAGIDYPDKGNVEYYGSSLRIEFLEQDPVFDLNTTVLGYIFKSDIKEMNIIREYESTIKALEKNPSNIDLQNKSQKLSHEIDIQNLWNFESQIKTILTKLGIYDFDAPLLTLSGGQRKRVALASALVTPCDLLILDEPTNHMDNDTIEWLEGYIHARRGALIMITHDRYFLDRVANRILELDHGKLYSYQGNYSYFLEKRLERREIQNSIERKRQNLHRRELEWIRRGAQARSTKQKARIDRFNEIENSAFNFIDDDVEISIASTRLGKKILEIKNLSKNFGDKKIIEDFSYTFVKEDRIGIVGSNGIGKSTFLNLLCDKVSIDKGIIDFGSTVKIAYFSQVSENMDIDMRAIDYIREAAEFVRDSEGIQLSASQMMEKFLFTGEMQHTQINKLSGGEQRRLYLLKILVQCPNFLILDEPTNDLDIDTLKILESYIDFFDGVVIAVSHDRYFLDRICNKIFSFEGNGKIIVNTGNYTDFVEYRKYLNENAFVNETKNVKQTTPKVQEKSKKIKLTYTEQREWDGLGDEILKVEKDISDIELEIANSSTDYSKLEILCEKKDKLEETYLNYLERYEYLSGMIEGMKKQ